MTYSSQAATPAYTAYSMDVSFSNAEAQYWDIYGGPRTTGTLYISLRPFSSTVMTDGSGKIVGTGELEIAYNTTGEPFSRFVVDYTGKISSTRVTPAVVTLNIKGTGYTADGTGKPTTALNTLALKFVGQPGINPLNNSQTRIVGMLSGAIRGATPLGAKSFSLPGVQAVITSSSATHAGLGVDVVQSASQMQVFDAVMRGKGSINTRLGTYSFTTRGTGSSRGESLSFSGFMGNYTNYVGNDPITFTAPASAQLTGKKKGQVVTGYNGSVEVDLIH